MLDPEWPIREAEVEYSSKLGRSITSALSLRVASLVEPRFKRTVEAQKAVAARWPRLLRLASRAFAE